MAQKSLFGEIELYDLAEISQLTGVSVGTLRRYIREGRLQAQLFGGKYRATKRQVEAFITGDTEEPVTRLGRLPSADQTQQPAPPQPTAVHAPSSESGSRTGPERGRDEPAAAGLGAREVTTAAPVLPVESLSGTTPAPAGGAFPTLATKTGQTQDSATPPQLLFMKPEDVDKLVASLAAHTDRLEQRAEERDRQVTELVRELKEENERLRQAVQEAQAENERRMHELSEEFTAKVLDPRREEQDRLRYTFLRGKLNEVLERLERRSSPDDEREEPYPQSRPWWRFW